MVLDLKIQFKKVGGFPSYCQSGLEIYDGFGKGFEFILQITSDEEINLNVIDNGSLMFAKNNKTNQWNIYYDFYTSNEIVRDQNGSSLKPYINQ